MIMSLRNYCGLQYVNFGSESILLKEAVKGGIGLYRQLAVKDFGSETKNCKGEKKMRNSLTKVQYLMFALLMFALSGCGAGSTTNTASGDPTGSGAVTAKLVWSADGKTSAKTVAAAPVGVTTVRIMITGPSIPTAKKDFDAASGGGSVQVYPGSSLIVTAQALDAAGALVYEGFATDVTVTAGATTDVGTINMTTLPLGKAAEAACLGCHETTRDGSGQNLIVDYKQSAHYANSSTNCTTCHTGANHSTPDPAAAGKCYACHGSVLPLTHVGNLVGTSFTAATVNGKVVKYPYLQYSTANNTVPSNNCNACHEPHNPLKGAGSQERKDWAESAHGENDTMAGGAHQTGACARCHSPYGFQQVLAAPTVNANVVKAAGTTLHCDACHSNVATGALRTLAGASATTDYKTPTLWYAVGNARSYGKNAYPDVAGSNLCVVCHDGTRDTTTTSTSQYDPALVSATLSSPIKPHNLPAAAIMYVKTGFINLSSTTTPESDAAYKKTLMADLDGGSITSTHRKLGTPAINGDSHNTAFFVKGNLDSNGPCVTCHLTGSHSLKIDQKAISTVCNKCHSSEAGIPITTISAFDQHFIEPQKEVYYNALKLAAAIVNDKNQASLKLNVPASATSTTALVKLSAVSGASYPTFAATYNTNGLSTAANQLKLTGALGNLFMFSADEGGYAHARTYSRRLIYDSLDFLDDGVLNRSVSATAVALSAKATLADGSANPVAGLYSKGATAYTDGTLVTLATGTTESMTYLVGWSRSTGAWNAVERP